MPATLAILSIVLIETISSATGVTDQAGRISHKLLSVLVLFVVSGANSISTTASTRLNNFFVGIKFFSILGVVFAGIIVVVITISGPSKNVGGGDWSRRSWFEHRKSVNPDGTTTDWKKLSQWDLLGHYSAALYGALWAYSGWDKVRQPRRMNIFLNVPRESTSQLNCLHQLVNFLLPLTPLFQPYYYHFSL